MRSSVSSLTQGPLGRQILLFSLPLVASNLLQVLFNMSDIAVVGRFAGSTALGAVGSTSIFVTLFTGFLIGLGGGINVLVARFYGAQQPRDVSTTVHSALLVSLAVGAVLLAVGELSSPGLLRLLNTKEDLLPGAVLYLRLYFLGLPAMAVYNFGNAVFSAIGDTKKPLLFLSAAGAVNILLNVFFVVVCRLSVAGVALASVLSQSLSAVLILRALARVQDCYGLRRGELRLDPATTRRILQLGIPAGCQTAVFSIANLFVQAGVNSFDSTMVKGNSAAANADALVYDAMAAFYTACSSFMSQNYGAGKVERVRKSYFISLAYSFGIGLVLGVGLVAFGPAFLSLFTAEAAVVEAGMKRLTVMGCAYCISAFMDCTMAASRGLGRTVVPTVLVILGSCVFRVVWVYTVFAHFHTIPALYLVFPCSWVLTAIGEVLYFVHVYKQQMRIFDKTAA
ncbi:MAG: MATE family efflux transporter [Faecalibacterium sp.]